MTLYSDPFPALPPGSVTTPIEDGHHFAVSVVSSTGRRRFRVYCATCSSEVHEATTAPRERMQGHARFMRGAS